jgi:DNA-binding response OmpR family regulator
LRPLLEHVLLDAGYDVTAVETVASARRLLDENPYDMVVADGTLIDGTGIDIAERAAEQGVAALIITGNALRLPQAAVTAVRLPTEAPRRRRANRSY